MVPDPGSPTSRTPWEPGRPARTSRTAITLERMLRIAASGENDLSVCGSCMDARALAEEELIDDARRGSMDELADWVEAADRVLVF